MKSLTVQLHCEWFDENDYAWCAVGEEKYLVGSGKTPVAAVVNLLKTIATQERLDIEHGVEPMSEVQPAPDVVLSLQQGPYWWGPDFSAWQTMMPHDAENWEAWRQAA